MVMFLKASPSRRCSFSWWDEKRGRGVKQWRGKIFGGGGGKIEELAGGKEGETHVAIVKENVEGITRRLDKVCKKKTKNRGEREKKKKESVRCRLLFQGVTWVCGQSGEGETGSCVCKLRGASSLRYYY
jgi:hypothetical protein